MNSKSYYEAGLKVLNWRKLSIQMQARYGRWKAASDATWMENYNVLATTANGQKFMYKFEFRPDAEACVQWWKDNNCEAALEVVNHG